MIRTTYAITPGLDAGESTRASSQTVSAAEVLHMGTRGGSAITLGMDAPLGTLDTRRVGPISCCSIGQGFRAYGLHQRRRRRICYYACV